MTATRKDAVVRLAWYLLGWAVLVSLVSGLWASPFTLAAALLTLTAAILIVARSLRLAGLWVGGAVLGPLGESICITFGAWSYTGTGDWIIPPWLPPAWGLATVCVIGVVESAQALFGSAAARADDAP